MRKMRVAKEGEKTQIVWREILRSAESRYDHRLHGVLAVCRGLSCYEAAAIWGRSPRSIEYWMRRFVVEGVQGLREKDRPGRPSSLTSAQRELLVSDLRRGPEAAGYEAARWTGSMLQRHLLDSYQVSVGVRQCQRMISRVEEIPEEAEKI